MVLLDQKARDEEPRQDEEEIDPQRPSGQQGVGVPAEHEQDRDPAQSVERRHTPEGTNCELTHEANDEKRTAAYDPCNWCCGVRRSVPVASK